MAADSGGGLSPAADPVAAVFDWRAPSEAEWRARLSPEAYNVLREAGTERPWSSRLNEVEEKGLYCCVGCGIPLFRSDEKFDSGSGWPSFWAPASDSAVQRKTDYKLLLPRTEILCKTCGGHLGHAFADGPMPTGQRYCMNGVCLNFVPEDADGRLSTDAAAAFAASKSRRPALATVLPEIVLGGAIVAGEAVGLAARGPGAGTAWGTAVLPWLPPGGLAGVVLLGFGLTVVARNVGLLLQSEEAATP